LKFLHYNRITCVDSSILTIDPSNDITTVICTRRTRERKRENLPKILLTNDRKVSRSSCLCIDLTRMVIKHESGAFVTGCAHYRPRRLICEFCMGSAGSG